MKNTNFYSRQAIDQTDINEVIKCLKSDYLTTGPVNKKFTEKLKTFCNAKYCVVVNSGTSALISSLFALNLKKNDLILVPAISFVATANCASLLGLKVKFVDVNPENGLINFDHLEELSKNNNIKVLINVHLNGNAENLDKIFKLCKKRNIKIIEDACHAFGTLYCHNKIYYKIGSNNFSDITTFSFHPVKTITTGEGGAILTNNKKYFEKIKKYISHGLFQKKISIKKYNWNYYDMKFPGYNFRLSDINCALGISQLKKVNKFINKRKKIAKFYDKFFLKYKKDIKTIVLKNIVKSSYHLYPLQIDFKKKKINKIKMLKLLEKKKIRCQLHYKPINYNLFYKTNDKLNGSQEYYEKTFSIPIHFNMTLKDAQYVAKNLLNIYNILKNA